MLNFFPFFRNVLVVLFVFSLLAAFSPSTSNIKVLENGEIKYLSNIIVVKLKETPSVYSGKFVELPYSVKNYLSKFKLNSSEAVFPDKVNSSKTDLGKIVLVKYDSDDDPLTVASILSKSIDIEWAEPKFLYEPEFIPNDPSYSSQWNLSKIQASLAWDINKGDTNIVIGIVDTGTDWDHPDLSANIWKNKDEVSGNGVDDDGNGFIDDIRGWDFGGLSGTPDNNPMEDRPDHGTHVSGIASAVTNNSLGVASIGYKCKIMPVKTSQDNIRSATGQALIAFGYEGIVYASDNGARIINCSWGGGAYSIFGQETINYAVSQGSLVVAAAGNSGGQNNNYPSGYNFVLSVASTNSDDTKSSFSTYGTTVDVSAPGNLIYSTWQNDTYATLSGTSMATPLTAGLAALVASQFPNYTALQIGEQVRVNSDNIDGINPSYQKLIGKGRINAFKSLSTTNSISARGIDFQFDDNAPGGDGDGYFEAGETLNLGVTFVNYLNPTSNLSIQLTSSNSYATITSGNFSAGSVGTLQEFNNFSSKYKIQLASDLPQNTVIKLLLNYTDGTYSDYQWTETLGNPTYATQFGNDIALTITSKGTLAFNDYPDNMQGDGFSYLQGDNALFEGALILGTSSTKISDVARGSTGNSQNTDFTTEDVVTLFTPGEFADQEATTVYNDNGAGTSKLGIRVKFHSYSFAEVPDNNYIILRYSIINTSASAISNLYAGLFFDWDFADANGDITQYDYSGNYGYVFREDGVPNTYIGTALLSSADYNFWAILNDGSDTGFSIYDGFTDSEKWQAISSGIGKDFAGTGDVSHVISQGAITIAAGDTIDVAFVIAAGVSKNIIASAVQHARDKYIEILNFVPTSVEEENNIPKEFSLGQNYPNPFNPTTKISWQSPVGSYQTLKIYDLLGNEVAVLVDEFRQAGSYEVEFNASQLSSGVYFYTLRAGGFVETKKLILMK